MRATRSFLSRAIVGISAFALAGSLAVSTPVFAQNTTPTPAPTNTPAPANQAAAPANTGPIIINLSQPIGGVSQINASNGLAVYIATWFRYLVGIVGLVATIAAIYGGFRYLIGSASGDIKAGKEIMTNAVVGMILVMCSYAILYTINPATVALKLPNITPISKVAFQGQTQTAPPESVNFCGDPTIDERYRRAPASGTGKAPGADCAYDSECQSNICFMNNQKQGKCSDLSEGQRCRCVGSCCQAMTLPNTPKTLSDTNNHGAGNGRCQDGLSCQFSQNDWKCTRLTYVAGGGTVRAGQPTRPNGDPQTCRTDAECSSLGSGAACIYSMRNPNNMVGSQCSLGREGDRCQCSGYGCDIDSPISTVIEGATSAAGNNHGAKVIACRDGLQCLPFMTNPSGTLQNPTDIEYFCQPVPARCDFSCTDAPNVRVTGNVCDANAGNADQTCFDSCVTTCRARGANCQANLGGSRNIICGRRAQEQSECIQRCSACTSSSGRTRCEDACRAGWGDGTSCI